MRITLLLFYYLQNIDCCFLNKLMHRNCIIQKNSSYYFGERTENRKIYYNGYSNYMIVTT